MASARWSSLDKIYPQKLQATGYRRPQGRFQQPLQGMEPCGPQNPFLQQRQAAPVTPSPVVVSLPGLGRNGTEVVRHHGLQACGEGEEAHELIYAGGFVQVPPARPDRVFAGLRSVASPHCLVDDNLELLELQRNLQGMQSSPGNSQVINGGSQSIPLMRDVSSGSSASPPPLMEYSSGRFMAHRLSPEERKERIKRYLMKKKSRNFDKKIKYACRKTLADTRPRVRGRFASRTDDQNDEATKDSTLTQDLDVDEAEVLKEENIIDSELLALFMNDVDSSTAS